MAAPIRCQINIFCRSVCLSDKRHFSHGWSLQNSINKGKFMQKILKKANRKKDKLDGPVYSKPSTVPVGMSGPMRSNRQFSEGMRRRARYLSEIMYEAVNQVIVCGELGLTPSITKVEVVPDCSHMNIYWEATGIKETDLQTQIHLDSQGKKLRHYIMQSHTHGGVPRPVFVADMHIARQREVDELFRIIAIEDEQINSAEEISEEENTVVDDDQFRQDLYGVPHDTLMKKIISSKTSASQRPSVTPNILDDDDPTLQRMNMKEATKFFKRKKSQRNQMLDAERRIFEISANSLNTNWDKYDDSTMYKEEELALDDHDNTESHDLDSESRDLDSESRDLEDNDNRPV